MDGADNQEVDMGRLWEIVETWRDGIDEDLRPSYRQIATAMRVAQSTFDGWSNTPLAEMPKRRNLYAISKVTDTPFHLVVQAAIDDADLFNVTPARDAFNKHAAKLEKMRELKPRKAPRPAPGR
jgi:hypothetical protein